MHRRTFSIAASLSGSLLVATACGGGGTGGSSTTTTSSTTTPSGTTSSTGGGGSTTGSGGSATGGGGSATGGGGSGGAACSTPADCPPPASECETPTCVGGFCDKTFAAAGFTPKKQVAGDCLLDQCDGVGHVITVPDDGDTVDDGDPCTLDLCTNGVLSHDPAPEGTPCGAGQVCTAGGKCAGCLDAADCPGTDTACRTRTCTAGVCGADFTAAGTPAGTQTSGDCKKIQCDGAGNLVDGVDDSDLPVDGKPCTQDLCANGAASNPKLPVGTACGSGKCDASGACVACLTAADCPGQDTGCRPRACTLGVCGYQDLPVGTAVGTQVAGDCHKSQCDGAGNTVNAVDDSDVPVDGKACTQDRCTNGAPSNPPLPAGTTCGGSGQCDGAGNCGCAAASDCPGQDTACRTRTCNAGVCGFQNATVGTPAGTQVAGDCHKSQCDGAGNIVNVIDNADVPVDGKVCTQDLCTSGAPSNPPLPAGTACNGTGKCDSAGNCGGCATAADCPATGNECVAAVCNAGTCGTTPVAAGVATQAQQSGDCLKNQCDGAGNIASVPDNTDTPLDDGNACTSEVCTAGVPSHPAKAAGAACAQNGGVECDGSATAPTCTQPLVVVEIGDGTVVTSGTGAAVTLERRYLTGSAPTATWALPVAANGAHQPFSLTTSATSEGYPTLAEDGHSLALAGYGAIPGTVSLPGSASSVVNRVVARISATGIIDTRTAMNAGLTATNPRSAASADGLGFWVSGGTGGAWYVPFATTGGTQIVGQTGNAPPSVRGLGVFGGQLYGSSASGTFQNVFTIGTGLPTAQAVATPLPGVPTTTGPSPYAFVLLDLSSTVPGLDTLYVADDRAVPTGGVQKWTSDGTTWSLATTFSGGLAKGCRGVTAWVMPGGKATVIATTADAPPKLVAMVDDPAVPSPTFTTVATAATNTVYRGVALAPR